MANLNTTGGAPTSETPVDGQFRRIVLREGGYVPSSASDTGGVVGEVSVDSGYIYWKTASGTWLRAQGSSW